MEDVRVFAVDVSHDGRGVVFGLRGELDFDSTVQLHEAGEKELVRGRDAGPVVADCSALTFCDSSGISALLRLFRQLAEQDRVLRLAAVPDSVARLFALTGLDRVFAVHGDVSEALAADAGRRDMVAAGADDSAQPDEGERA
ncbi:STAS domain-containing protein [Streptomyces sp. NPDC058685]|uniref:STAS domain-containing protein n=1 Tax=Streptomyces sp. NPDC058685 TaxID=3346598 RepID=UPI0036538935